MFWIKIERWLLRKTKEKDSLRYAIGAGLRFYLTRKRIKKCRTDFTIPREKVKNALNIERPFWVK